jgi:hypothetical protein
LTGCSDFQYSFFYFIKRPDIDIRDRLPEQFQRDSILIFQVAVKYYYTLLQRSITDLYSSGSLIVTELYRSLTLQILLLPELYVTCDKISALYVTTEVSLSNITEESRDRSRNYGDGI